MEKRVYGRVREVLDVPSLGDVQTASYRQFLQSDRAVHERVEAGLEGLLREIFPIESFDKTMRLEYLGYELAPPAQSRETCEKLKLTYCMPWRVRVRLCRSGEEAVEETVYLGDVPAMVGGGEFVINGATRVIVSQLHRSPGVDFSVSTAAGGRRLHTARLTPERGSWVELLVDRHGILRARIDQSAKFPATAFLRCFSSELSSNAKLVQQFYPVEQVEVDAVANWESVQAKLAAEDIVDSETGELVVAAGDPIGQAEFEMLRSLAIGKVRVVDASIDPMMLDTVRTDETTTQDEALVRFHERMRPGYPSDLGKAKRFFEERFGSTVRYSLGSVGRFRLCRKFGWAFESGTADSQYLLTANDLVACVRYLLLLRAGHGQLDDIDHLGHRRVRPVGELFGEALRKGLLRLKRSAQERMSLLDPTKVDMAPRALLNHRLTSAAILGFFGRGELSQVLDQTNPLAQLTHERRLSALGPGGLNRKRAGFEVRDVHISHYGRICPIETPEGANIGLISSLAVYARLDELGFLVTPYRVMRNGRFTGELLYLRADEEHGKVIAPADVPIDAAGCVTADQVLARQDDEVVYVSPDKVDLMDVSPKQLLSLSASLIPFVQHDDANRALMGSNMQRQAVPLMLAEAPIVATGMEGPTARSSSMVVIAQEGGVVTRATSAMIQIGGHRYDLKRYRPLADKLCLDQKPCVRIGQRVQAGDVIADGAATQNGQLALGRNVLVAFMSFEGFNFEDAILVSDRLRRDDVFTSVHVRVLEVQVRETDLGREEITADLPNVARKLVAKLDEDGIVRVGTRVVPGDILVGKVAPKGRDQLDSTEKLLRAIFGRMSEEVRNESLTVPLGVEGVVTGVERFERRLHMNEDERRELDARLDELKRRAEVQQRGWAEQLVVELRRIMGGRLLLEGGAVELTPQFICHMAAAEIRELLSPHRMVFGDPETRSRFLATVDSYLNQLTETQAKDEQEVTRLVKGDQLPPGVVQLIRVTVANKRKLSVGDKMAGRHGNKGVVASMLPVADMPHLADGTPVDIVLNPLGVPSRMNIGQILETHLGWAAHNLGIQVVTPVFDGATEDDIGELLVAAGLPRSGSVQLFDGRTGTPFDQTVTVGYLYMLKLNHMVEDKLHARSTGPYSLITQQPLGGKARRGGQRLGEMEVWALEAYGAANVLQELLTVKSDDVDGRARIYESLIKGRNVLEPSTPVSFGVLVNEIKGLALNFELERKRSE